MPCAPATITRTRLADPTQATPRGIPSSPCRGPPDHRCAPGAAPGGASAWSRSTPIPTSRSCCIGGGRRRGDAHRAAHRARSPSTTPPPLGVAVLDPGPMTDGGGRLVPSSSATRSASVIRTRSAARADLALQRLGVNDRRRHVQRHQLMAGRRSTTSGSLRARGGQPRRHAALGEVTKIPTYGFASARPSTSPGGVVLG